MHERVRLELFLECHRNPNTPTAGIRYACMVATSAGETRFVFVASLLIATSLREEGPPYRRRSVVMDYYGNIWR